MYQHLHLYFNLIVTLSVSSHKMDDVFLVQRGGGSWVMKSPKSAQKVWHWRGGSLHPHPYSLTETILTAFLTSLMVIGIQVKLKGCPKASPSLKRHWGYQLLQYDVLLGQTFILCSIPWTEGGAGWETVISVVDSC